MRDRSQLPKRVSEVHNAHYEDDVRYTMQLCGWVLKPIGMWYLIQDSCSRNEKIVSIALIVVCFSALCFVLIPSGLYLFLVKQDVYALIKLLGPVIFCLTSTIKYCYLGTRGAAFGRCLRHVTNDWRLVRDQDHREIMLRGALIGRRLTMLCAIFLYTGGLSYHTILPLSSKQNISENFTSRRVPHTYPGYDLWFDPEASPAYEIVFCVHCVFALITYNITTGGCGLAAIFVTHACGQVQILMIQMSDLVEGKRSKGTVQNRLSVIAKHHVRVLRFSASVDEVLREICLMELLASCLTICLLEYYCIMEWENSDAVAILTYFILLISFMFNILIFCYIGELLMQQYSTVASAVYGINWYDLSGKKALDLKLIIAMSRYPVKLTAGKFVDLSLNTFGAVLRTSVVYLNLLRTVTE
ncbi:ObirOr5-L30 [Ooceraea biroi]|uniref:Odorant receptor n=3 Tax=Ooceraea biroi TaxID=2015173 RepID=A0A3L8D7U7_OOCBI|nr:ObirOr5-L30 [Ooceraea biroi]